MGARRGGSLKPVSSPDTRTSGHLGSLYTHQLLHAYVHHTDMPRCVLAHVPCHRMRRGRRAGSHCERQKACRQDQCMPHVGALIQGRHRARLHARGTRGLAPCVMMMPPMSRVDAPQLVCCTLTSAPASSRKREPNTFAKLSPSSWLVPACTHAQR